MLKTRQNYHRSELPKIGAIVEVQIKPLFMSRYTHRRYRKFIVVSYPLCDNVLPYSKGIHTCNIKALDNGREFKISGFYCKEIN